MRQRWHVLALFGSVAVALAAVALTPVAADAAPAPPAVVSQPVQPSAQLPADLVALEQKMKALRFNTERLTLQVEIQTKGGLLGPESPGLVFLAAGSGDVSVAPDAGSFRLSLFGTTNEIRQVGGESYVYEPTVAKIDGGRSWVRSRATSPSSVLAVGPAGLGETIGGSGGSFSSLVALLSSAAGVQETGPAIVDDQPVTEFTASVDPRRVAGWSKLLVREGGALTKEPNPTGGAPTSRLELFLSPSGLPVRIRFALQAGQASVILTSDTLALEVPVTVTVPPPNEVIDQARLKVLEKRRHERQRARLRRTVRPACAKSPVRGKRCRVAMSR